MSVPADRRYLDTHEWHRTDGPVVTLGLTQFAVDELTDVTYVQLPKPGTAIKAGQSVGEIESVKATSDLYTGITGTIAEVNAAAVNDPSLINKDPFNAGWLLKITPSNPDELNRLMDAKAYEAKYPSH
jgi:glycine cleavage system H protein